MNHACLFKIINIIILLHVTKKKNMWNMATTRNLRQIHEQRIYIQDLIWGIDRIASTLFYLQKSRLNKMTRNLGAVSRVKFIQVLLYRVTTHHRDRCAACVVSFQGIPHIYLYATHMQNMHRWKFWIIDTSKFRRGKSLGKAFGIPNALTVKYKRGFQKKSCIWRTGHSFSSLNIYWWD